jgi:hypothetical protein
MPSFLIKLNQWFIYIPPAGRGVNGKLLPQGGKLETATPHMAVPWRKMG